MISFLRGRLAHKDLEHAVIDVSGVGYQVFLSLSGLGALPDPGVEVQVHTHTHVREDALVLFGFVEDVERQVFRRLIAVNGIGPRLAINILGGIGAEELTRSIAQEDLRRLQGIPGVGKKLAERMLVELRGKLPDAGGSAALASPAGPSGVYDDLASALLNLGYKKAKVDKAVDKVRKQVGDAELEVLLREALRLVS